MSIIRYWGFTLLFIFQVISLNAQSCEEATDMAIISNDFLRVNLLNGGDAFWNLQDGMFIVPDNPANPVSSVFAGAMWIGGFDQAGNLKMAAQTYRQSGNDFWPGPLNDLGQVTDQLCSDFDRIWTVPVHAVYSLIADFEDNNVIDDAVSSFLLQWPGRGNPFFLSESGFDLPDQELAPFYDRNGDGMYNPMDGEYPVFTHNDPEAIAWKMTWSVFNDRGNIHTESMGDQLGVEVQQTFWALKCTDNDVLNNSLFCRNKIINKSLQAIDSVKVGQWMDFDLGCYNDDYIGSAPALNSFYIYNGDNNDLPCSGVNGYGVNPPAFAATFLNHELSTFLFYIGDFAVNGNPENASDFYNYISGSWKNGWPWEYGGDGLLEGTFPNAFFFPSNPNDNSTGAWSEVTENNSPGDRRGVGSVGPFFLAPGEHVIVDMAFSYHRDETLSHLQNVDLMYSQIPDIQMAYDNHFSQLDCSQAAVCLAECVWPGDANANGIVNHLDLLTVGIGFNTSGLPRDVTSTSFEPKFSVDWALSFPSGLNYKHADCYGDGQIGIEDGAIVEQNYGLTNDNFSGLFGTANSGPELYLTPANPIVTDTLDLGLSIFDIIFKPDPADAEDIFGLGFRVNYPPDLIQFSPVSAPGYQIINSGLRLRYDYNFEEEGHFDVAIVRTDDQPLVSQDSLFINRIVLEWDLFEPDQCQALLSFDNLLAIDSSGNSIPIGKTDKMVYHSCILTNVEDIGVAHFDINIFPNPASNLLHIDIQNTVIDKIEIYDAVGQQILHTKPLAGIHKIDISLLPSGLYFISFYRNSEVVSKRLSVVR